jgi:hypothetical protein
MHHEACCITDIHGWLRNLWYITFIPYDANILLLWRVRSSVTPCRFGGIPVFRTNISPPSSRSKSTPSKNRSLRFRRNLLAPSSGSNNKPRRYRARNRPPVFAGYLFGLLFDVDDEDDVSSKRRWIYAGNVYLSPASADFFPWLLFYPEDRGDMFHRNVRCLRTMRCYNP